jgi:hypothetical protein
MEPQMNTGDHHMNTKRMAVSLLASVVMSVLALAASASQTWAAEPSRPWATVGSVGTMGKLTTTCPPGGIVLSIAINQCSPPADPPILEFEGARVALPVIPTYWIPVSPPLTLYKEKAVIRYNIVAVDGLFQSGDNIRMKVRFLDIGDNSQLILKLIEFNPQSGVSATRMTFDSNLYAASSSYQEQELLTSSWTEFDFSQYAYYIEATMTRSFYRLPGNDSALSLTEIVGPGLESIQLEKISP